MKKKLFITLAILSILACIFAISVSAKTVTTIDGKEVTVTTYDDAPARTNITVSTDDVVVFDDGFCCPSAYVTKDQKELSLDFSWLNGKTGKSYAVANVVELDISEGITFIGQYYFNKNTTLKKCSIPATVTTMQQCVFQQATGLEELVFEHTEDSGLTSFPNWTVWGCTSLKAFSMPDCITQMSGVAQFNGCSSMTALYLSKNLTAIYGGQQNVASFGDCTNMYFVNEPFTYDEIPQKPSVYYFPKNLTSEGFTSKCETFKNCKNLNDVLVFPIGVTEISDGWAFNGVNAINIVFLGDMEKISTTGNAWNKDINIYFCNENDTLAEDVTMNTNAKKIFCNAEGNTQHLFLVESNTAPTCTAEGISGFKCFCGLASNDATIVPALGHEKNELLAKYFAEINGTLDYYNDMITEHSCTRCEATVYGTEDDTALFNKKGYAYSEGDSSAFSYTIYVNEAAIKAYNAELLYGIVVSANVSGAPISLVDGAISHDSKTIAIEFQNTDIAYSIITAKLTGIPESTELHLSAYCVDGSTVSYLGHDTVATVAEAISHEILVTKYPSGKED